MYFSSILAAALASAALAREIKVTVFTNGDCTGDEQALPPSGDTDAPDFDFAGFGASFRLKGDDDQIFTAHPYQCATDWFQGMAEHSDSWWHVETYAYAKRAKGSTRVIENDETCFTRQNGVWGADVQCVRGYRY